MILWLLPVSLLAQEPVDSDSLKAGEGEARSSNINFDGRMLAGLNGDSSFSVSMTQGLKDFAYQLNSDMIYNNDFEDYSNSGFFKNETGFTGELTFSDLWKMIPEFEIANSSYSMFDNSVYSEEKKDKILLRIKNEYKPAPARWSFDFNFGRFDHRLKDAGTQNEEEETFYSQNGIISMDYVWSASNKVGFRLEGGSYKYPDEYEKDVYSLNEFYGSFKITEFIMLTISPSVTWNKDGSDYLYFKGNISTVGLKYLSLELLHDYKQVPYKPDEYVYSQKFIDLPFDLPPSTINHSEVKAEVEFNPGRDDDGSSLLRTVSFRVRSMLENNDNLYNYYSTSEDIIAAEAVAARFIGSKAEFVTKIHLFGRKIGVELVYEYYKYFLSDEDADINITYRPEAIFSANFSYAGPVLSIDWNNSFNSEVYTDPYSDSKLDGVILGNLDLNIRVDDTFYLYSRINNIYDREYSLTEGYPEPGVHFFAGIRVMI